MNDHKYRPAHKFFSPNIAYYIICLPSVLHRCYTVILQCRQLMLVDVFRRHDGTDSPVCTWRLKTSSKQRTPNGL